MLGNLPFNFWNSCNLKFVCGNERGGLESNLWLCCEVNLNVDVISNTDQQITVDVVFDTRVSKIL